MAADRISTLLHEASETHHVVWLLNLSELPELFGAKPVRSHLVHALVQLDRDYIAERSGEPWEDWYAARLADRLAG
jgi:hypothetical protein